MVGVAVAVEPEVCVAEGDGGVVCSTSAGGTTALPVVAGLDAVGGTGAVVAGGARGEHRLGGGGGGAPGAVPVRAVVGGPCRAAARRAEAFSAHLAPMPPNEAVRAAALELQAEEAEHVGLVKAWMAKVPQPDSDWSDDPDPPRYID